MDLRLRHYAETVFDAKLHCSKRFLLSAFSVPHPVMAAYSVKGYLDKRIAAYLLHSVKLLLRDEIAVCVKLLNIHPALVDSRYYIHKPRVEHRLTARYGECVDTAVTRLIKQVYRVLI